MTFRTPHLNGFLLFGLIPWVLISGAGIVAYGVLLALLLVNRRFVTIVKVAALVPVTYALVYYSPQIEYLSAAQINNSYNTYFAWMLVLTSPLASSRIPLRTSRLTDVSLWLFCIFAFAQTFLMERHNATFQIASYTIALYILFADTHDRKIFTVAFVLLSGARAVASGFIVGIFLNRFRRLRAVLSTPVLFLLIFLVTTGSAVAVGYEFLTGLREQQILLKGRTNFWLTLIDSNPGLMGNGAGKALLSIEEILGRFHLPHNDWLRLYTDFGLIGVLLTLIAMFMSFRRNDIARLATTILAFYMITGNPLSFPTVIVSFFIACQIFGDQPVSNDLGSGHPLPRVRRSQRVAHRLGRSI